MPEQQEITLGDLIVEDLESQLSEPDPRYARKCRELAVVRAQYKQLLEFVRSKKDVLGLTELGADGEPPAKPEDKTESPQVNGKESAVKPVSAAK